MCTSLLSCAALLLPLYLSAAPAYAADPTAPYAELTPDSGEMAPGGDPLTMDATFHNTLDTDITDSFIVAVGIRLAPPADRLTPDQVTVEWFDAGPSVWRPVELTPGDTALSGYLSTDAGLPSVGSLPAGDSARIPLRVSLASGVPAPATLQFVTQGLIQPTTSADPAPLMDGKASYSVVEQATPPPPTPDTPSASLAQGSPVSEATTPTDTPSPAPSSAPPSATTPAPSAPSDGAAAGGHTDGGTSASIVAAGVAGLVFAAVVAVGVTLRRRRSRY
ncbi:hypothetical protein [Streptomyces sp. NPDC058755]|uniref:hypothetical protein n=1 Tax=Streptomyces sp. NPDC058755 TaxID=3346624 RepID=UPI0036C34C8E